MEISKNADLVIGQEVGEIRREREREIEREINSE